MALALPNSMRNRHSGPLLLFPLFPCSTYRKIVPRMPRRSRTPGRPRASNRLRLRQFRARICHPPHTATVPRNRNRTAARQEGFRGGLAVFSNIVLAGSRVDGFLDRQLQSGASRSVDGWSQEIFSE